MKDRVRALDSLPPRPGGRWVLYWAQANRRVEANHGLAFAVETADSLGLPVLYHEALTCSGPGANDRMHTFILEGVPETQLRLRALGIGYVFHLRRRLGEPGDALSRLAREAAVLVTDDHPAALAPAGAGCPCYAVDSSCVVPMNLLAKREYAAYTIRPKIRRLLPEHLKPLAVRAPRRRFEGAAPAFHTEVTSANIPALVAACEIDHAVPPSAWFRGGRDAAGKRLSHFLAHNLRRYAAQRREPAARATSGLSPYLHAGQISSLEVALAAREHAGRHKLIAEEFLEELIVRRELAFNFARHSERPAALENLPSWALETLTRHAADQRPFLYRHEDFEAARTHDRLWNAAQKEMLARGAIHGYYRMYWGKKIIEWSAGCQEALETMVRIHDRWALDGRDPNTWANILWCFGLHDRPWLERPVFGTVRYLSLDGMRRKTDVEAYVQEVESLEWTV